MNNSLKENNARKLLIIGLDNAGKTSIVLSLKGHKNLLSFYSLNPTKGVNIVNVEALGSKVKIWDFGGQEIYRNEYLQDFDRYVKGTDKVIFVIDVQDRERYDLALSYLEDIVNLLKSYPIQPEFSLFLHKFDPGLKEQKPEIVEDAIDNLILRIKNIIPSDFIYQLYKTTIYTNFEKIPVY